MTTDTHSYSASSVSSSPDHALTLRRAFITNAAFSFLSGLLFLLDSAQIAEFLGIGKTQVFNIMPGASFILELGVVMLAFAGWVAFTAIRPTIARGNAIAIFISDSIWVVASIALILAKALPLTSAGNWAMLIAADIVLAFAVWEIIGIRRMAKS